jgi:hypothetical protein
MKKFNEVQNAEKNEEDDENDDKEYQYITKKTIC